ncbi:MAG: T9SS C-terminal target domain-containing protein [Nannocystales bacterium]
MRVIQGLALCGIGLGVGLGCSDGGSNTSADSATTGDTSGAEESGTGGGVGPSETMGGPGPVSSAGTTDTPGGDSSSSDGGDDTSDTGVEPMTPPYEDVRNYIFGHSLILHSSTANVPRWIDDIAEASGYGYSMSGRYGFADTHANDLPPVPQWGIDGVDAAWNDDDGIGFGDVDFNTVLFTEANFRQYFPPTEPEPDLGGPTSVGSTLTVFDWVENAEPGVRFIVYENWPDMGPYTDADFETTQPTEAELAAYWAYTAGDFHQWWLDYHDALLAERPELTIHMVPVGPVLAELLTGPLSDIPPEVLYEDNAPHGRESLYFLAGLVTSMAMYAGPPPASYQPPEEIDVRIRERYSEIVETIWAQLLAFEDGSGARRAF